VFRSFEDLEVWKRACVLAVRIYRELADCRDFGLRDQMQRAAISVASNIAEGAERGGKDFARFLSIARGSAAELRTQAYIAARVGVLTDTAAKEIVDETKQIARMLVALAKSLNTATKKPETENRKLNAEN
jgi:four helix bundle protein